MTSDPDIPVIFAAGFGLLLFAIVSVTLLWAVFAAIKHKRWGLLLGGFFACFFLLVGAALFTARVSQTNNRETTGGASTAATIRTAPAKVASNRELLAVAAAEPQIDLEDQPAKEADSEERAEDEEIVLEPPAEPRPEWMTAELEENQQRFTSGPFTTVEQCRADARLQLTDWVWEMTRTRQPDFGPEPPANWTATLSEIAKRFGSKEHLEKRQTSVGEVYLLHALAQINDENDAWLDDRVEHWVRESRQTRGMRAVVVGGGVALGLLGLGHSLLRLGSKEDEEPEARA